MGFFARLGRLIRGFFSLFIGGLEEKNPKAMLEDLKNQLNAAKVRYNTTTANIIAREKVAAAKLKSAEKELEECRRLIQEAKRQNDRELALQLLIQEEHLEAAYNTALEAYNSIKAEADHARQEFENFQAEMFQKMSQIEQLKVQADLADLKKEMNTLRSNFATESGAGRINEGLKQAEELIQSKLAKEEAIAELGKNSIDSRMRSLKTSAAKSRAEEKLRALFGDEPAQTEEEGRVVKERTQN
ncbi:phage shock protein A [Symbiobacterium terraclitae]|uniref:Phage shock protein A n=1 Tax=Symbiobacterium terraclitae TaxID=557451 RepID=A0ABS4JW06_9FIRM|nr:PspA/IM30 family protein [Symbiobacterium terraclitae]MBP2019732.1 phage shock protein A [Symbiobacterium terraclitae]